MQKKTLKITQLVILTFWFIVGIIQLFQKADIPKDLNDILIITNLAYIIIPIIGFVGTYANHMEILKIFQAGVSLEVVMSTVGIILNMIKAGYLSTNLIIALSIDLTLTPFVLILNYKLLKILNAELNAKEGDCEETKV